MKWIWILALACLASCTVSNEELPGKIAAVEASIEEFDVTITSLQDSLAMLDAAEVVDPELMIKLRSGMEVAEAQKAMAMAEVEAMKKSLEEGKDYRLDMGRVIELVTTSALSILGALKVVNVSRDGKRALRGEPVGAKPS